MHPAHKALYVIPGHGTNKFKEISKYLKLVQLQHEIPFVSNANKIDTIYSLSANLRDVF